MTTLAQSILDVATDIRNKQNGISEKELETIIEAVMKGGGSTNSPGSLQNLQQFQKEEAGRTWNNTQELYILPSDKPEQVRLDKQHIAVSLGLGGLNPCPELIEAILKPEPGITKSILDLGCGTGIWSFEMARAFPSAKIVGLDLVPIPLETEKLPANFEMVVGDINTELPRFQGQFDLVYMRFICIGLNDIRKMISEAQQCLKPGGLLLSLTPDMRFLDSDQINITPIATDENLEGSWLQRLQWELKSAAQLNGTDKLAHGEFLDGGIWDDELMDPDTCGAGNVFLPMSPWTTSSDPEEDVRMKLIGLIMKQNMDVHDFWVPLLKKFGWEQEKLERCSKLTEKEMIENRFKLWMRI